MVSRLPLLVLPALLAATAPGQLTRSESAPFELRTAHAATAQKVLDLFGAPATLPKLDDGGNWLLTLAEGGELTAHSDDSLISALQVTIRPEPLMKLFPGRWEDALQQVRNRLADALRTAGLPAPTTSPWLDALAALPAQASHVRIRVDGDLDDPRSLAAQAWMRPRSGTWLDDFVRTVKPLGLPTVARIGPPKSAAMSLRVAVELDGDERPLDALFDLLAASTSPEQRASAARAFWGTLDGSLIAEWNARTGSVMSILGLRDPDRLRKLHRGKELRSWMAAQRTTSQGFEIEFTPDAVEHRGASLWKSVARPTQPAASHLPTTLQSEIVSHGGIVETYLLGAIGADQTLVEDLIDRARQHSFHRDILSELILARLRIRPRELLAAHAGELDLDQLPATVVATVGNTGELFFFSIKLP